MTVSDFFKKYDFSPETLNPDELISSFENEMNRGLAGEPSTVKMYPAFLSIPDELPKNRRITALDAGGTNLRSARVHFDETGKYNIENFKKGKMPGAENEVSREEFYNQLTEILAPNLAPNENFGFCFSYPTNVTSSTDSTLMCWSKNIKAPSIIGTNIGRDLQKELAFRGFISETPIVLNDTVATLLASPLHDPVNFIVTQKSYVSFILGTGTNTAYSEKMENVAKLKNCNYEKSTIIINCESGGFGKFRRSEFDRLLDETSLTPGIYFLEKTMAGAFLGDLCNIVLQCAQNEKLLPENLKLRKYSLMEFNDFATNQNSKLFGEETEKIRDLVLELIVPFYERAALFAAVNIAAVAIRATQGKGTVCVNVNGSTFYKTKIIPFQERVREHLANFNAVKFIIFEFIHIEDAPILGAAIAASDENARLSAGS